MRGPSRGRALGALGLASAVLAPIVAIGGWTVAQMRQPSSFDALRQTISALAAHGAADRWVMNAALFALGACHLVTALGLGTRGGIGRLLLGLGGIATVAVAALPQPDPGHLPAAGIALTALAIWPLFASVPGRRARLIATASLVSVLIWFALELFGGQLLGLSERILVGAEATWPVLAVLTLRSRPGVGS